MTESLATTAGAQMASTSDIGEAVERVLISGDLASLKPPERVSYYNAVCRSLQLNPLTKPFDYITLNGKLVLYANRGCTEQLRKINKVAVTIVARELIADDIYVVVARAVDGAGRSDESIGAVPIGGLRGEAKANALMKAETKAKRRVTLSICGLGMLDETEVDSISGAKRVDLDVTTPAALPAATPALPMPQKKAPEPEKAPEPKAQPQAPSSAPAPPQAPSAARQKAIVPDVVEPPKRQAEPKEPPENMFPDDEPDFSPELPPSRGTTVAKKVYPDPEADFLPTIAYVLKTGTRTTKEGAKIPYTLYCIKTQEEVEFLTFSKTVYQSVAEAIQSRSRVMFDFAIRQNKDGNGTSNEATAVTILA